MAKTPFSWTRLWAIVRATFGVAIAAALFVGSILLRNKLRGAIGRGIFGNLGGNGNGQESASQVQRDNSDTIAAIDANEKQSGSVQSANREAIKRLDDALDILRRARERSNP